MSLDRFELEHKEVLRESWRCVRGHIVYIIVSPPRILKKESCFIEFGDLL